MEPRRNQTALALLSLIDDDHVQSLVRAELVGEEARVLQERASSFEAAMLAALLDAFADASLAQVAVSDLTERFNRRIEDKAEPPKSNKWVGWCLRTRLRLATTKSRGVYVVSRAQQPKIEALAKRYGVSIERADAA